ncbi:MAG: hypothetical protein GC149_15660 [Gammaproteobacteria bacterium]|nr:hypothetical protein [Gammaproteobacteria bacterium]
MKIQHMHVARIIALSMMVLFLVGGCQKKSGLDEHESVSSFKYKTSVGWLQGPCLAIENDSIKPGSRLVLVLFKDKPALGEAFVESKTNANCPALNQDRESINRKKGMTFYSLKSSDIEANTIAIAVLTDRKISALKPVSSTSAQLDINGDGRAEEVNNCVTSEGIKFFIWPEKAYSDTPLWEDYYYLGYDLKPTCPAM